MHSYSSTLFRLPILSTGSLSWFSFGLQMQKSISRRAMASPYTLACGEGGGLPSLIGLGGIITLQYLYASKFSARSSMSKAKVRSRSVSSYPPPGGTSSRSLPHLSNFSASRRGRSLSGGVSGKQIVLTRNTRNTLNKLSKPVQPAKSKLF